MIDLEQDQRVAELVDEQLRELKPRLRAHREAFGVRGDMTYELIYKATGELLAASIERAPADLTPEMAAACIATIMQTVRLPASQHGGSMSFTDLGPDSATSAALVNVESDAQRRGEALILAKRKERKLIIGLSIAGVVVLILEVLAQLPWLLGS